MLLAYRRAVPLLRIPFSVYLMPVFWFGLSALREPFSLWRAAGVFVVLHVLAYPASNGYNSYYDRDEGSIGGLKKPPRYRRSCCIWCGCLICWRWWAPGCSARCLQG
ncbi:hypothetical protein [Hymenobacter qilianensis]|uniref:hypothetical protein n=1 Tax=Hymenobacter qilianensis TaxID=1385715 RepID=UPI001CB8E066|nr:hypothetical protein [Hymenobacter qilianensis]